MENLDLGRLSSSVLTEVRTVLSRAETALGTIERNPNLHIAYPKPTFADEGRGKFLGYIGGEKILHPDVEEMIAVLQFAVQKLSKWRKTGPAKHREGELDVPA